MDSLAVNLLSQIASAEDTALLPLVGFCHSYDTDEPDTESLRRIRVTYPGKDGAMLVSPFLFRVCTHPGSDPPLPSVGDLVFGFWLNLEHSKGVYLGTVINESSIRIQNFAPTKDWFESCPDGTVTIRAKTIRLISTEGIELMANVEQPNYAQISIGGYSVGIEKGYDSEILFRDGYGAELNWRAVYNAVNLDEDPQL